MVTLTDRYIDTDSIAGRLAAAGVRARLRDSGDVVTLTVKRAGLEALGVTTRVELEAPATRAVDPEAWPDSMARTALLDAAGDGRLREIARLRQRRLTRRLRRGSTVIELSLDALEALDGAHVAGRRYELEAELISGDEDDLASLSDALRRIPGVGPALGSKLRFALDALSVR
jgi:inorganic triphosphatase YgiF